MPEHAPFVFWINSHYARYAALRSSYFRTNGITTHKPPEADTNCNGRTGHSRCFYVVLDHSEMDFNYYFEDQAGENTILGALLEIAY